MKMKIYLFLLFLLFLGKTPAARGNIQSEKVQKDQSITFKCGDLTKGSVMWSRDRDRGRDNIGRIENGFITRFNDSHKRYNNNGLSLIISPVSPLDAGLYYCNSTAVACLTVISGSSVTDKCENAELSTRRRRCLKCEGCVAECWSALAVVGSVLLAVVSVFTWRWFSQKKLEDEEVVEHVYASINSEIFDKAETGGSQKQKKQEAIYYLATHPAPDPTGLLNDPTYSLIQNPTNGLQNSDPDREGLYSLAQRPSSSAEEPQTSAADS